MPNSFFVPRLITNAYYIVKWGRYALRKLREGFPTRPNLSRKCIADKKQSIGEFSFGLKVPINGF